MAQNAFLNIFILIKGSIRTIEILYTVYYWCNVFNTCFSTVLGPDSISPATTDCATEKNFTHSRRG
jgi:hypothetical protein